MLNRTTFEPISGRILSLRNAKYISTTSNEITIQNHVWFTPEVIILDALSILANVLILWKFFIANLPSISFRIGALTLLLYLAFGLSYQPNVIVADSYKPPVVTKTTVQIDAIITASTKPEYEWPIPKNYITSNFSFHHQGIDIPASYGTPVEPFSNGKVVFANWDGGFGKIVIIRHDNGLISKYAHLSTINVSVGQEVGRNNIIGRIGTTGFSTGAHLHFETHGSSGPINPLNILP